MTNIHLPHIFLASMLALTGCTGAMEKTSGRIGQNMDRLDAGLAGFQDRPAIRAGGAQVTDGIFVGATAERASSASLLPARLRAANAVSLQSRDPMTLDQIAQRLGEITGVPHLAALGPAGTVTASIETTSDPADVNIEKIVTPQIAARISGRGLQAGQRDVTMRPSFKGPLANVLDEIAAAFSVEWSFSDGRIVFRDFVTRQYQISALPSRMAVSSTIGAGEMLTSSSMSTDIWEEIQTSIGGIIGEGANVSLGSGTGLVTVTAKIADHDRIADYVTELNGTIGQQIAFDVNVLTVSMTDTEGFGVNLTALLQKTNRSISILGNEPLADAVGAVNIGVIQGNLDMNAVVEALSKQGRVSVDTKAGATTSNNRVVPIKVTDRLAYIKSQTIETDSNNRQTRSVETDEVETGFQLQIFPRILNNREVMVQYTVSLSELRAMQAFGDGADTIQLPQISETSFEQQAVIQNGQTLILAGFERERTEVGRSGLGNARMPLFGGSQRATNERVSTVILITPRILNRRSPVTSE